MAGMSEKSYVAESKPLPAIGAAPDYIEININKPQVEVTVFTISASATLSQVAIILQISDNPTFPHAKSFFFTSNSQIPLLLFNGREYTEHTFYIRIYPTQQATSTYRISFLQHA